MTLEDWESWRAHPVTQWVFRALEAAAETQRLAWMAGTWEQGQTPDPLILTELKVRADSFLSLSQGNYEDFCAMNGEQPED